MDAPVTVTDTNNRVPDLLKGSAGGLLIAASSLLLTVAFLFAMRRIAGGLSHPLPTAMLISIGVVLAGMSAAIRFGALQSELNGLHRSFVLIAPTVGVAVACMSISLPGSSIIGLCSLWSVIVSIECASFYFARTRPPATVRFRTANLQVGSAQAADVAERVDAAHPAPAPHGLAAELSQQVQRGMDENSGEYCHGMVRARFVAAQRTETLHVSFCPPFLATPELHVEQIDGPDAQVKITQLLPYGARLEVRLASAPVADAQAVLEFSALEAG
jgi:hypothetical protein